MRLQTLLPADLISRPDNFAIWQKNPKIKDIHFDSRRVVPGSLFFAFSGFVADGKKYIADAITRGAVAIIVDEENADTRPFSDKILLTRDARQLLAMAAVRFFQHPSRQLAVFGVTGSNGKTSTAFLLRAILEANGEPTALMGTVERSYPGKRELSDHTTQEAPDLQRFLVEALQAGVRQAVIEVSSHALSLARVEGLYFAGSIFTNLAADHQDFYQGMEPYYQAKKRLFTDFISSKTKAGLPERPLAAINIDDEYGMRLANELGKHCFTYACRKNADVEGAQLRADEQGVHGEIKFSDGKKIAVHSLLAGTDFNRYNILAAAALAWAYGIAPEVIARGIATCKEIPGRLVRVEAKLPFQVFIDFAHSGPKLRSVLLALRELIQGRLIVVFGAGGDKDPARRTTMGAAAAELAEVAVITTDNPRSEAPEKIIEAIVQAHQTYLDNHPSIKHERIIESDRRQAIARALKMAKPGDIVCIAGKGHEEGQIVGDKVYPFNDYQEAAAILREMEIHVSS